MRRILLLLTTVLPFISLNCHENNSLASPLHAALIPDNALTPQVRISDLNYWSEQGQFFVTGICNNESAQWQKIWLQAEVFGEAGKSLKIKGFASVVFPTFSHGVPPKGRTSFFAGWPLSDFAGVPDSCLVTGAGAVAVASGPILLVEQISGVKMLAPKQGAETATEEKAWQINAVLNNPMPMVATHPRLELLLFGTDNRLWFSTMLDPEDPVTQKMLSLEKAGPMQAGEKRGVGVYAFYERLPLALKEKKIGRVEMLGFEGR